MTAEPYPWQELADRLAETHARAGALKALENEVTRLARVMPVGVGDLCKAGIALCNKVLAENQKREDEEDAA